MTPRLCSRSGSGRLDELTEIETNPKSGEGVDSSGMRTADKTAQGVVAAFGQTMKTLRLRAGMERQELGKRLGYSAATIASFEQGRRIPSPRAIYGVDEVLDAGGLLKL